MAEQIGLAADIARDAVQAKQMLAQGNYAAVTVDLMLSGQDGIALIRELRAAKRTAALPILVVSFHASEVRKELHDETLNVIDWIDKPVNQAHFLETLKQAVEQVFSAQPMMPPVMPDGGTPKKGDHDKAVIDLSLPEGFDAVMNQLEREVARARRKKTPLSLAIIDIDAFQRVNDTYGHLVGESVIQSLSRLLVQRLRQTDLIGRCGAEEFAVILCDTDGPTAVTVLDKIRKEFSGLHHFSFGKYGKEFSVTFSCGIADISRFDGAAKLGDAAGEALYKAKHIGQDQIVLA